MKPLIPDTDNEGYLLNPDEWNEDIALAIAELENIPMTAAHWEVVRSVKLLLDL